MRPVLVAALLVCVSAGCAGGGGDEAGALPATSTAAAATGPETDPEAQPLVSALPGAEAFPICAAGGDYWPTMVLAIAGPRAWVACKEEERVVELDLETGAEARSIDLLSTPIAVATGFGSVWALDSLGTLTRIAQSTGDVEAEIDVSSSAPYNVWIGADSVWVADDAGGEVVRINPVSNDVVSRIPVGDGPADMAFADGQAWVVNHRDRRLVAIDTERNRARRLVRLPRGAPERMELLDGSLWVTGRGVDLLRVDPATGEILDTVDVGASGIDVLVADGALWIPSRSAAVDPSGFPTMDALRRVTAKGRATTPAEPTGPLDVHGLAATEDAVWLADTTNGVLYRFPTG
jgi:streptogramin lyase